jgi:soluble lytic murein transglycosylase-like protein
MASLMGGCSTNSSSNSSGFDMALMSLLEAVAKVDHNNNHNESYSTQNNLTTNTNTSNNLETLNSQINTNRVESTNSDKSINERIDNAISVSSKKHGVDPNLIRAIIKVESDFNPKCVSSAGAKGLMQLMPENCKDFGVTDPFNIEQNIEGGTREIKSYLDKYNGNVEMALMAYNGGPSRMARRGVKSIDDIYKMPKETQNYVPKVMKYYKG